MTPSLYEWAGGEPAFARLIDCFHDRIEGDDLISPLFPGGVSREHRDHVATWWREVFGGPARYTDELRRAPVPRWGGARRRPTRADGTLVT